MTSTPVQLLQAWYRRIQITQLAHYSASAKFSRFNSWVGIPSISLSAIIATSIFATIRIQPELWIKVLVGLASLISAVLTGLQTFLSYTSRADKHRTTAAKYGIVGRRIEHILSVHPTDIPNDAIDQIRKELDTLALESPDIPDSLPSDIAATWRKYKTEQIDNSLR